MNNYLELIYFKFLKGYKLCVNGYFVCNIYKEDFTDLLKTHEYGKYSGMNLVFIHKALTKREEF